MFCRLSILARKFDKDADFNKVIIKKDFCGRKTTNPQSTYG